MTTFSDDVKRMVSRQVAVATRGYVRVANLHVSALERALGPVAGDADEWARYEVAALRSTLDAFAVLSREPQDPVPLRDVLAAACLLASGSGAQTVRARLEPPADPDVVDAPFAAQRLADILADLAEPRATLQARWVATGPQVILALSSASGAPGRELVLDVAPRRARPLRLLVVDDDLAVRSALRRSLRRAGHVVVTAGNGEEALAAIQGAHFDAVISDVDMPAMDGLELLEALRREAPALAARILFVTGRLGDDALRARLSRSGAPFFAKPADVASVLARLEDLTRSRAG